MTNTQFILDFWRRRKLALLSAALLLLGVVSALFHLRIGLTTDTLSQFSQMRQMLEGNSGYSCVSDVNPPLIRLLYVLPYGFFLLTGIGWDTALNLFGLFVTLLSLFFCHKLLRRSEALNPYQRLGVLAAVAYALLVLSFQYQVFADREHLIVALLAPYLLACSPLIQGRLRWTIRTELGVMAGIAVCIKPYYLLFVIAAGSWRWLMKEPDKRKGLFAPELLAVAVCVAAYGLTMLIFFRDYLEQVVPVARDTYRFIQNSPSHKLDWLKEITTHRFLPFLLPVLLMGWALRRRFSLPPTILYTSLLFLTSLPVYWINGSWLYTRYPADVMAAANAIAAMAWIYTVIDRRLKLPGELPAHTPLIARGALLMLLAALFYHVFTLPAIDRGEKDLDRMNKRGIPVNRTDFEGNRKKRLSELLKQRPRFMLLSANHWAPWYEAVEPKARNVGRFDYLYSLPGAIALQRSKDPVEKGRGEEIFQCIRQSVAEDLRERKPELVIVDGQASQRTRGTRLDLQQFFNQSEAFRQEWAAYENGGCMMIPQRKTGCTWYVFYRKDKQQETPKQNTAGIP